MKHFAIARLLSLILLPAGCRPPAIDWTLSISKTGTYSSPRAIDLNGDGIKDIVLGAGGNEEWEASENGVLAIDGAHGELLWKVPCRNQIVGSPVFLSIDDDGVPDVVIGGRSAQLLAISGRTGAVLWEYLPHDPTLDYRNDTTLLNFFTPQLTPDLDKDQKQDFLIAYGGFVQAPPNDPNRPAGCLMLISSATGRVIHRAPMPDGKETYLSPVVIPDTDIPLVVFGTGGETLPGNLYLTPLHDLLDDRIDQSILLAAGREKGFIAPPVLVDITGDGRLDIIVNAYEGATLAIDGQNYELLWKVEAGPDFETHSQPAITYLNGDGIPDFFVHFSQGKWPESYGAKQLMIDGKTGAYQIVDSLGSLQMSSPVAIDDEPFDRILLAINEKQPTGFSIESGKPGEAYTTKVVLFDPAKGRHDILKQRNGINLGSTLLIEDLDGNGAPEMIHCFNLNPYDIKRFGGLQIECNTLEKGMAHSWNQYMGAKHDAVFHQDKLLNPSQ